MAGGHLQVIALVAFDGQKPDRQDPQAAESTCYNSRSRAFYNAINLVLVSRTNSGIGESGMSGHSKWATIKHKKGALDAKRGKIFTRLIKEITMAAKGGGDAEKNPRLRTAIAAAKAENMPADNIKRAIQRGTGELPGVNYEEFMLEGYGPGGVAVLVDLSTDNRNRTVSEIRHAFGKHGGNMGEAGSVSWMFHKKGSIVVSKSAAKEDDLMNIILEAGGEDLRDDGETWEILTDPSAYEAVLEAVKNAGIKPEVSEVAMVPQNYIKLEGQSANTMIRLLEALEDQDDVQHVYSNFDMDEAQLEAMA
jgi:YebC/PmpR family DNA-binding regulatory protein